MKVVLDRSITILGDAGRDKSNGSKRVFYRCSCGYEGSTRASRAKNLTYCKECAHKYNQRRTNRYSVSGEVAFIDVSTSKFPNAVCEIDASDIKKVIDGNGRWFAVDYGTDVIYVVRSSRHEKIHRLIADAPEGLLVDHNDGNGLNNKKSNLNVGTQSMNMKNRVLGKDNLSGIMGVSLSSNRKKWIAQGGSGGKAYKLGEFDNIRDAIRARKQFERLHGFNKNHGRVRQ